LVRRVPHGRVRETVIVHPDLLRPAETRLMTRMCGLEPQFPDWALRQLGVHSNLTELLADTRTRLWTPGGK
jgi:hypothetical protein